jgi:cellulose synthase/poly-beta-1,6-N-acetylglucosamine synthase-like glycosyltransferase
MGLLIKIAFWICLGAIAYNYIGYPFVLFLLATLSQAKSDASFFLKRKARRCSSERGQRPRIAIIISAFNEQSVIGARVKNALEINYPPDLAEILIGLDSPTDSTAEILARMQSPRLHVFHFTARRGKLAVISDLAHRTGAEIFVFTDANTMFEPDCVANLVRHFQDPKVGAVSGEEVRVSNEGIDPGAEALYWRYESALKILESRIHCLHSVNGGVYAIRSELFRPHPNLIVEDFQIPLEIRFRGHWIVYDPEAIAIEEIAPSFTSQFERRVRLGAGDFQTFFEHPGYLNPLKGLPSFAYWSHRVLRWLGPLFLVIAFVCNVFLISSPIYLGLLLAQSICYVLAGYGYWLKARGGDVGIFSVPLHFSAMNLALFRGMIRHLSGRQKMAWEVTPRTAQKAPM